jgi:hypothetical protein
VRLPLIAALGLLVTSFGALVLSLSAHSERSVEHLVTVPGVQERLVTGGAGAIGTGTPSGNSPFAVYVPPSSTPRPGTPAPAQSAPAGGAPSVAPPKHHRN